MAQETRAMMMPRPKRMIRDDCNPNDKPGIDPVGTEVPEKLEPASICKYFMSKRIRTYW
jgi:hypothetical protein